MFKLFGVLAAMMSSVSGNVGQERESVPIQLVAEPAGDGVRLRVVGASQAAYFASFALEVTSEGNRSLHKGSANLQGGDTVTLSTITLGNAAPGRWRAHLRVEPQDGQAYEQVRTSF